MLRKCEKIVRVPATIHAVIADAARANGRTIPQEMARRLEQSMSPDECVALQQKDKSP